MLQVTLSSLMRAAAETYLRMKHRLLSIQTPGLVKRHYAAVTLPLGFLMRKEMKFRP